jgi:hypothetical protein
VQMLCLLLRLRWGLQAHVVNCVNMRYIVGDVCSACSEAPDRGDDDSPRHKLHTASREALRISGEQASLARIQR